MKSKYHKTHQTRMVPISFLLSAYSFFLGVNNISRVYLQEWQFIL